MIKQNILLFVFLAFFSKMTLGDEFICNKAKISEHFELITKSLKVKNALLSSIVSKSTERKISLAEIWGHDLKEEAVKTSLSNLEQNLASNKIILDEHLPVYVCLEKLKENNKKNELSKLSEELLKSKIYLLAHLNDYHDFIESDVKSQKIIPTTKEQIELEDIESQKLKKGIQDKLVITEAEIENAKTYSEKELIQYRANLEKTKLELININLQYSKQLEQKIIEFERLEKELLDISKLIDGNHNYNLDFFVKINLIWKKVIESAFANLIAGLDIDRLPRIEDFPFKTNIEENINLKQAQTTYNELSLLRTKIINEIGEKRNKEVELKNILLYKTTSLRRDYFSRVSLSSLVAHVFTFDFWNSIRLELYAAPYRIASFYFVKTNYIKQNLKLGYDGYKNLSLDFLLIIFTILGIYAFRSTIKYVFNKLNNFILRLFYNFRKYVLIQYLNLFWIKIRDNFIDVSWILFLLVLESIALFDNFELIFDAIIIFITYKVLLRLIVLTLSYIASVDGQKFNVFMAKANSTSVRLGKIYLLYSLPLLLLEGVVGRVYLYTIIKFATIFFIIYGVFKLAKDWEAELELFIEKNVSGVIVEKFDRLLRFLPARLKPIALFIFFFVMSVVNFLIVITEDFNFSKKISANLFRRQIEKAESFSTDEMELPRDYLEKYQLNSLADGQDFIMPDAKSFQNIIGDIDDWMENSSEEKSLIIYGDKGIGKTTLLKKLMQEITVKSNDQVEPIYAKIPSKTLTEEALLSFLSKTLSISMTSENLQAEVIDEQIEKPIILFLDEVQNIFLTEIGGFKAYYMLANIINLDMKKIYWVMSFNKYSWLYLDKAFGKSKFFRNAYCLQGWSDQKIKELIMRRHNSTSYKLSYDILIRATKSEDEIDKYSSIENKFFKLLWEMSDGNPRAAISLWRRSLRLKSHNTFTVHIPSVDTYVSRLNLTDDTLFVLAHVTKHENLNQHELEVVTNFTQGICRNAIKVCLERGLLFKDPRNRYMLELTNQYDIIKLLKSKNYIYGN